MRPLGLVVILLAAPAVLASQRAADRAWLIVVDDLHLSFEHTGYLRDFLKRLTNATVDEGERFAVVTTGPSAVALGMTRDRWSLVEAIRRISGAALKPTEIDMERPDGAGPNEARYRAHVAIAMATDAVRKFERLDASVKTCLFVSSGYDAATAGTASESVEAELAKLATAANRADITIYTIDPRRIAGAAPERSLGQVDAMRWQNHLVQQEMSLKTLAELTGGFAVLDTNDLANILKRIGNDQLR